MKILFLITLVAFMSFNLNANPQSSILEKVKSIRVISWARADVEKLLGKGKDNGIRTWYVDKEESVQITYSDGTCTEGFLAPKDTVIQMEVYFKEDRKLSELKKKVDLKKLRLQLSYDTADKIYYDDELGIAYEVNEIYKIWSSIIFYPSKNYSNFACEN
jgi:hypothetical protein